MERQLEAIKMELEALEAENLKLQEELNQEKARLRDMWRMNCQCLAEYDTLTAQQESDISRLYLLLAPDRSPTRGCEVGSVSGSDERARTCGIRTVSVWLSMTH